MIKEIAKLSTEDDEFAGIKLRNTHKDLISLVTCCTYFSSTWGIIFITRVGTYDTNAAELGNLISLQRQIQRLRCLLFLYHSSCWLDHPTLLISTFDPNVSRLVFPEWRTLQAHQVNINPSSSFWRYILISINLGLTASTILRPSVRWLETRKIW